eukprot:CAMPEP_0176131610 /NCGR_PEP_ID=MMETSP0120_2-20121206/66632_1 /TAXON_ID=160619 /ORGANISM="Kryptoperidinium foliaceum, Strain CCMP 1326" /LENGTH=31 /DNA_ID= /DNA_START= /DNA_END= /DNA_ORIENTATION=
MHNTVLGRRPTEHMLARIPQLDHQHPVAMQL